MHALNTKPLSTPFPDIYAMEWPVPFAVKLKYIPGRTLRAVVEQSGALPTDRTLRYLRGIYNGLEELRRAGMDHGDLTYTNIVLDEKRDEAVLIDIGDPRSNRRMGGPSPYFSMAQLAYHMATTDHLFGSRGDTICTTLDAGSILRTRRQFVEDTKGWKRAGCYARIRRTVKDERMRNVITSLLEVADNDHDSVRALLEPA
jgi:serine/threonine protein kinase